MTEYLIYTQFTYQPWTISMLRGSGTDGHSYYGESIDKNPFDAMCRPTSNGRPTYITKACWDSLRDSDQNIARSRCQGIVTTTGYPTSSTIIECFRPECLSLLPDPCDSVVCEDKCYDYDLYNMVCEEGTCVDGSLIESNSSACGYIPPLPEPEPPSSEIAWVLLGAATITLFYLATRE